MPSRLRSNLADTGSPINTYNGWGVAARGIVKSHHSIIYTGDSVPPLGRGEEPSRSGNGREIDTMRQEIQVIAKEPGYKLDPMARLNWTKTYQIDHGCEIYVFGNISDSSMRPLHYQYRDLNNHRILQPTPAPSASSPPRIDSLLPGLDRQQGSKQSE